MATPAPSFVFGYSFFLKVKRTSVTSQMSSNFDQIRPMTAELHVSVLECLKKSIFSVVATLAPSLILEVTRTSIISRMSLNFDQIRPLTAKLSALECLKNQYFVMWPL